MAQQVEVSADELIRAFQQEWPLQYEVTALRLINAKQAAQLSAMGAEPATPRAEPIAD